MSDSLVVCDVDPELIEKLKKFRFQKETNNTALIMKVDKNRQLVVLEEEFQDMSPEQLSHELPERQPRYPESGSLSCVFRPLSPPGNRSVSFPCFQGRPEEASPHRSYRYTHDDGRVSYPLCFIFSSPAGCKPEQQMMYAGSKNRLVQAAELTKVFEIRSTEELTEQWLKERLAFFR
ncbi:glia maturation factor gamma [Crotalus adamanteus]|uniref:Glia maturation factor gamma n=1 Tax=Crotalus adamanteus TaxID=8729 RepID=A0AAW1AXD0_CROAD